MKKSELVARYRHFGEELIPVSNREFFKALKDRTIYQNNEKIDGDSDVVTFGIEGWDFYCYSSCFNVGWQGDKDCDAFYFKIKRMTEQERIDMMKLFSRENNYTIFEE